MTKTFCTYQDYMVQADHAIDHFHKLLIEKKFKEAQNYLCEESVRHVITMYYGKSTFVMFERELEDALALPF